MLYAVMASQDSEWHSFVSFRYIAALKEYLYVPALPIYYMRMILSSEKSIFVGIRTI
jgi:hypothetical protein